MRRRRPRHSIVPSLVTPPTSPLKMMGLFVLSSYAVAAVLGLFTFMQAWNDFFWPLVVLVPENPTVQTALSTLASGYTTDYTLVLTAATIGTVPVLAVFLLFGRQIVGGIMSGAVKG